ncbi:MAG: hypothetical protein OHK0022_49150 [Roseiflexaceae bacterium]
MAETQLKTFMFTLDVKEPSVFQEYVETVVNEGLLAYRDIQQYGGKQGQRLYAHVLNGICVLEQLRQLLDLSEIETRILFTAYTLHDLNKVVTDGPRNYGDLVTPDRVRDELLERKLDLFFPEYETYLEDIVSLMRGHSGHHHHGAERLDRTRGPRYGLGSLDRIDDLLNLIRAADTSDLAHSLDEHKHLDTFRSHLNKTAEAQYNVVTHRLGENRGILTNLIHNAVVDELRSQKLIPLLFFPDGVAYLIERGQPFVPDDGLLQRIAARIASALAGLTARKFDEFIDVRPLGIRIAPKCLELGLPFRTLLNAVDAIIQRRTFKPDVLAENARRRAQERLAGSALAPEQRAVVEEWLAGPLVAQEQTRLRLAEHIRTYYIFLNEHFKQAVKDPWARLYDLLEVPAEKRPLYEVFDARQDRSYVLVDALALSGDEVWARIERDGASLLGETARSDPREALFAEYLRLNLSFSAPEQRPPEFSGYLKQYVSAQYRQCVMCSSPFATADWMKPDVREEIAVNTFSNRLRAGPGEPKKRICPICQIQFLLEKLVFEEVRGEQVLYLHLFPYSFMPEALINGLRNRMRSILLADDQARTLFLRPEDWIGKNSDQLPLFVTRTAKGTPHPYGMYVPRYPESIGNLIILPLNPPGDNDTERFVYTLQQAMLLQRDLGMKVLISRSPVAPLESGSLADLYIDNPPLACRGLVSRNDFPAFADQTTNTPGPLTDLWEQVHALHRIKRVLYVAGSERDPLVALIRALGDHPLAVFFAADRLLEERIRKDRKLTNPGFMRAGLAATILPDLRTLSELRGGSAVALLSEQLQALAEIASDHWLRGKTWSKNSLMTPLDEVFKKLNHRSAAFDEQALRAVIINDIFEYLYRIANEGYKPGAHKREGIKYFVDVFFDQIYAETYRRNLARLLADERMLRSAFYLYVQEAYTRRAAAKRAAGEQDADEQQEEEIKA